MKSCGNLYLKSLKGLCARLKEESFVIHGLRWEQLLRDCKTRGYEIEATFK